MPNVARIIITVDNAGALRAIQQTSAEVEASSDKMVASDERVVAANKETTASFGEMKKGVGLLGTVAFAALGYAMDKSVKAALNWQTQQASLQQALKNTGNYSKAALTNVNASVEALSTHGGFSEGSQLTAITQLIGETHSLTAAQKLNVAATDLARGAHLDYAQAVKMVEGASIGQGRAIQKLTGVIVPVTKFTYGWTSAMKAADEQGYEHAVTLNKLATAQEILGRVQKNFHGQLKAYNATISAQLNNLKNGFEILFRQLGQALLPTVSRLAKVFTAVGEWMTHHMGTVKEIAKQVGILALVIGGVVVATKLWAAATAILDALAAANPWVLVFTAIALVIVEVATHVKNFGKVVTDIFNGIKSVVGAVVTFIGQHWKTMVEVLIVVLTGGIGLIGIFIVNHFNQIVAFVASLPGKIANVAVHLWDGLKTGLRDAINFISGLINKYLIGPLNDVITVGGLLNFGQGVPNIPMIGGGGGGGTAAGALPGAQSSVSANSSVPAGRHNPGDSHTTIPIQVNIDGRIVAETTVHHIQKRTALA